MPWPYGGKSRQVQIDIDPVAMQARGLSGQDVANALAAQNLIIPVGTEKIGTFEYTINLNNAPSVIKTLGDLPIKPSTAPRSTSATWPRCATAVRRRPTSFMSTATAPC